MSTSPEGVITWGGWAPKESIGHTWKNSLHCDQKDIVRKLSWNLRKLPEYPLHMSTFCWACHWWWHLLGRVRTPGGLPRHPRTCWRRRCSAAGCPWSTEINLLLWWLVNCHLSSPIDALGAEPCLRQQGVRVALRPVRFLVVICKEECALATLE